jgi:RNA polymerase sigma-70 factor (ECF subfamily)
MGAGPVSVELAFLSMIRDPEAPQVLRLRGMVADHFDTVWHSLRRLGVSVAGVDDGAQQVFMVAARRLNEIEIGGERRYLLGIAVRVASDARRAVARRREVPLDPKAAAESTLLLARPRQPDEELEQKRELALLAELLDEMPDELREAFVLFELEELSAPEVGRVLDIPIGTVASRVRRARERLRESLAKRGMP